MCHFYWTPNSGTCLPLDGYIFLIYLDAAYGECRHTRNPRTPLLGPPLRLRDQGDRRSLHPVLLGGELRPDLSRASPARAGGTGEGRGRAERFPAAAALPPDAGRSRRAGRVAAPRRPTDTRASRRVAVAHLLRGRAAARRRAAPARDPSAHLRARARDAARNRRQAGQRSAIRRPRPSLGDRVHRMGDAVVRGPTRAAERRADAVVMTVPSVWGILRAGLPGFMREGFLPVAAFYLGLKVSGLAAGIGAAAVASAALYAHERAAGREGLLVR